MGYNICNAKLSSFWQCFFNIHQMYLKIHHVIDSLQRCLEAPKDTNQGAGKCPGSENSLIVRNPKELASV